MTEHSQGDQIHLEHAKQIIHSVSGKHMSLEERKRLAVELAAHILLQSYNYQTQEEKAEQAQLYRMMNDPMGKPFTTAFTDQCFRPHSPERVANQILHILDTFGVPQFFPFFKRLQLLAFRSLAKKIPKILVPLVIRSIRKETEKVILPGEAHKLRSHIEKRKKEGVRLNINHLGEAILGEEDAESRFNMYLHDLEGPDIDCVSVKISTIYSQINLLSPKDTIDGVATRLRRLYRAAMHHPVKKGKEKHKLINLDMEEYQDLHLTKDLFKKVLTEPEFHHLTAGIVLQAYLPDSYEILKELTEWAQRRVADGGAPIRIRIVKGANMAMEQFIASVMDWPQAPYTSKIETDANYRRMLIYALNKDHINAVHIGIASHNLFDISFALLLCSEQQVEKNTMFEMLEGMANHTRKVVQALGGQLLLYCGTATKEDFHSAIAYLIRRLDENTSPENYLRHSFHLTPGSEEWDMQVRYFFEGCNEIEKVSSASRRTQNRLKTPHPLALEDAFHNEPDTDFSILDNAQWASQIVQKWANAHILPIPCVVNGQEWLQNPPQGIGRDPSYPEKTLYHFSRAPLEKVEEALSCAQKAGATWAATPLEERAKILAKAAQLFREKRGDFLGVLIADGGKTLRESDPEYSEAIDFIEYYIRSAERIHSYRDLKSTPKGVVLVTPPWNFPVSIPVGGIAAGLITGNAVILKPASDTVLCGWEVAKVFWEAGVPKDVLQFITCAGEAVASKLIESTCVNMVVLTGATSTARLFYKLRPGLDLYAETGGKNAIIVTAMSDRDLAIKHLIESAFGHAGQKCSAASLAILEKEVYDDPAFLAKLRDAAASLKVASPWDLSAKMPPLIHPPGEALKRGLTTLEEGEQWLLEPKNDPLNPNLWSPGIRIGVRKGSFTHRTELFGPVLSVMRAENLVAAVELANSTPYGLTAGLQSLDEREQLYWQRTIIAGNCYINRTVTGAIVQRQPFGGCKGSSFGHGSKAGGPNYLLQFLNTKQIGLPKEKQPVNEFVNRLSRYLERLDLSAEELGLWYASIANYAFWWQRFQRDLDVSKVVGQDNLLRYVKQKKMIVRVYKEDSPLDYLRIFAAGLTCECPLQISIDLKGDHSALPQANWQAILPLFNLMEETEEEFLDRIADGETKRVRLVRSPSEALKKAASGPGVYLDDKPVLANGRLELLNYLREVSLSIDYHRYGYLGLRENEMRKPIL